MNLVVVLRVAVVLTAMAGMAWIGRVRSIKA